jgi:hypothetical protein
VLIFDEEQGPGVVTNLAGKAIRAMTCHGRGSVTRAFLFEIRTAGGAAARRGLKRTTLQSKMRKLGISRPGF